MPRPPTLKWAAQHLVKLFAIDLHGHSMYVCYLPLTTIDCMYVCYLPLTTIDCMYVCYLPLTTIDWLIFRLFISL